MDFDQGSTADGRAESLYADVIIPRHIAKSFTYIVPPTLAKTIRIGSRVLVPFGHVRLEGAVVSLATELPSEARVASLKEISSLVPDGHHPFLSPQLLQLSRDIATYYVAPWGQCLRLVSSPFPTKKPPPVRYLATPQGQVALSTDECPDDLRPTLQKIARRKTGILASTLQPTRQGNTPRIVDILLKKSWVTLSPLDDVRVNDRKRSRKLVIHESRIGVPVEADPSFSKLPASDEGWNAQVTRCLQANRMQKLVLHAPWPHRVRRLADAIIQAHRVSRSTIVVTGEFSKARWLTSVLSTLTGLQITLLNAASHSTQLEHTHGSLPRIVIGTRSAIFAPVETIGLIWVEGEEDTALKEPQEPRYHARHVAGLRAESERALLILASEHPSLESKCDPTAEHQHIQHSPSLRPKIELVNLRQESGETLLSHKLLAAMRDALDRRTSILLFLNRKGYARALVCRDCSWVPRCVACAVPLAYYREAGRLLCHYCGSSQSLPDSCAVCYAHRVSPLGGGTERIEAKIRRLFPHAKVARLDGDTLRRPAHADQLWESARAGAWDILIGTQILFRRDSLPQHELVGILQADSELHISDFRSAERTYQLLIDAANLASPASAGGRVIVQTRFPSHHAVQALISGNPDRFYEHELAERRLLHYPPLCHLAELTVIGHNRELVAEAAQRWALDLGQAPSSDESIIVLGPVQALSRRARQHHQRMLVKATDGRLLSRRIHDSVQNLERQYPKGRVKFAINIDPVETG